MSNLIKQSVNCPKCDQDIEIGKQRLIKCSCGADLIIVKVGGKYLVCNVTPEGKNIG